MSTLRRSLAALGFGVMTLLPLAVAAQDPEFAGTIHAGTCDAVGDPVVDLNGPAFPTGERVGSAGGVTAAQSLSTLPLSLDAILGEDHALLVPDPGGDGVLACGDLGGVLDEGGALVVGLLPRDGAGVAGIAYLSPSVDPAQTDVSLFVAGRTLEETVAQDAAAGDEAAEEDGASAVDAAEGVAFASGGLGLPLEAFEAVYGQGMDDPTGTVYPIANGRISVSTGAASRVNIIARFFDEGVSIEKATAAGLALAPADAVLVETYVDDPGGITVDLYSSASLAAQFPDDAWTNGEPGNFTVSYSADNPAVDVNVVTRLLIVLGNNP
jgi:hypothetical protein